MIQVVLISLVVIAIITIGTSSIRNAVIYNAVFSMAISYTFLLYNAPDLAIAEAVISSVITTIIYFVALKQHSVFTVFCHLSEGEVSDKHYRDEHHTHIIELIKEFCYKQSLEPYFIYTTSSSDEIIENYSYELIMEDGDDGMVNILAHVENIKIPELREYIFERERHDDINFVYIYDKVIEDAVEEE